MEEPFIEASVLLEKMPGKGGWTFIRIPSIPSEKKSGFGWKKVRGFIDEYELHNHSIMPMGKGQLFVPVKASIRKSIGKEAGEWVKLVLYADRLPAFTPSDFLLCLEDEPEALFTFQTFSEQDRKKYFDWIAAEADEEARIGRMAQAIDRIVRGGRLK